MTRTAEAVLVRTSEAAIDVAPRRAPVQRRSTSTIDYLLEAAGQVIADAGRGSYTTNVVAERAGVSIGTLYRYFPNKQALTAALILRAHERIVEQLRVILRDTEGRPLSETLRVLADRIAAPADGDCGLHRVLEAEEERLPRLPELVRLEREIETLNGELILRHLTSEYRSPEALEVIARDIVYIVRALTDAALLGSSDAQATAAERLHRTLLGYLAPLCHRVSRA